MIVRDHKEILDFLEGKTEDYRGRTYQNMLDFSDKEIENCHDQIQHLFPLHEESDHAHTYPVVDKELIEKARNSSAIQINLVKAVNRMEKFFGIGEYEDVNTQRKWCRNFNHNLLRVTRIIRSLRLFGLDEYAKGFYDEVVGVGDRLGVSQRTLDYWNKAMNDDIWKTLK